MNHLRKTHGGIFKNTMNEDNGGLCLWPSLFIVLKIKILGHPRTLSTSPKSLLLLRPPFVPLHPCAVCLTLVVCRVACHLSFIRRHRGRLPRFFGASVVPLPEFAWFISGVQLVRKSLILQKCASLVPVN